MSVPPIIPANTAIETFRDNGYKNTASSISELIDNSIDAKAKNIQIIVFEKTITKSNRPMKQISEIAIVDDGSSKESRKRYLSLFSNEAFKNRIEFIIR